MLQCSGRRTKLLSSRTGGHSPIVWTNYRAEIVHLVNRGHKTNPTSARILYAASTLYTVRVGRKLLVASQAVETEIPIVRIMQTTEFDSTVEDAMAVKPDHTPFNLFCLVLSSPIGHPVLFSQRDTRHSGNCLRTFNIYWLTFCHVNEWDAQAVSHMTYTIPLTIFGAIFIRYCL